jgi:hypothetical protein
MEVSEMTDNATELQSSVRDEVMHWFFDDYLTTWIGVGAGTIARGPEFILDYWGVPLYWGEADASHWLLDAPAVVEYLQQLQARLRDEGYAHTAVPHYTVRVYHRDGAAIEVIWSRCRADRTEIERLAVHFELGRGPAGWRILGVQAVPTSSSSLGAVWPQAR